MDETVLEGGSENPGLVVRIGDTVRRPRGPGAELVEALLTHLHRVGFIEAPEFLGVDEHGRQVLRFLAGEATDPQPWQHDDRANAEKLGEIAALLRRLHDAAVSFRPPLETQPRRALALPGTTWTHGDVGYSNIVYAGEQLVGLIDWEFAAPGHRGNDLAALVAMSVRGPKLGAPDNDRRQRAVDLAIETVVANYGLDGEVVSELPSMGALVIDDALTHWGLAEDNPMLAAWTWRAEWFRSVAS